MYYVDQNNNLKVLCPIPLGIPEIYFKSKNSIEVKTLYLIYLKNCFQSIHLMSKALHYRILGESHGSCFLHTTLEKYFPYLQL